MYIIHLVLRHLLDESHGVSVMLLISEGKAVRWCVLVHSPSIPQRPLLLQGTSSFQSIISGKGSLKMSLGTFKATFHVQRSHKLHLTAMER